jgi:hypothetical protein
MFPIRKNAGAQGTAPRNEVGGGIVSPLEFLKLLVSHRRMVRIDRRAELLRGLQDLDSGEVFYTHEVSLICRT